jgi:MFS family permease
MPVFWSAVAEIVGRKPVYLIAQTIFIVGTIVCSRANSMPLLIVMRIIQVGRRSFPSHFARAS